MAEPPFSGARKTAGFAVWLSHTPPQTLEIPVTSSNLFRKRPNLILVAATLLTCHLTFASKAKGDVTIDFWNPDTGEGAVRALQQTIDGFQREHPGVKVNLVNIPWSDIFAKW
jgi:ABC-type glycerol-3-phosphate transport system substrate-binding protein